MKVSEAKTKICPFIENKGKDVTYSDFRDVPKNIHCLCEKCMAWEWTSVQTNEILNESDFTKTELIKIREMMPIHNTSFNFNPIFFDKEVKYKKIEYNYCYGYCKMICK